jgi:hypothetical protein
MSNSRIKFYANWIEFLKENALDPDLLKCFQPVLDISILVPAGPGWGVYDFFENILPV